MTDIDDGLTNPGERCVVLQEVSEPRGPHRRQDARRKRSTGEPPSLHEWQAQVRVLRHKAAALRTSQPPSRSQVWISGHWRQETARTNRQAPQQGRQDTSSLPNLHGFSKKCGDWPRADLFRGATPDFHRSAKAGPSKDRHFRGHVASSRKAYAEGCASQSSVS